MGYATLSFQKVMSFVAEGSTSAYPHVSTPPSRVVTRDRQVRDTLCLLALLRVF